MDPEYLLLESDDDDDEQSTEREAAVKLKDVNKVAKAETVQQKHRAHKIGDFKETVKFVRQVEKGIQDRFDDIVAFPSRAKRGIKEDISDAIDMIHEVEENLQETVKSVVKFSKAAQRNLSEVVEVAKKVEENIEQAIGNIVEYSHKTSEDIKDVIKFAKETEQDIQAKYDQVVDNSETLEQLKVVLTSFRETSGKVLDLAKTSLASGLEVAKVEALEASVLLDDTLVPLAQERGAEVKNYVKTTVYKYCDKCCEDCGTALFKVKGTVESGFEIAKDGLLETADDVKLVSGTIKNFVEKSLASLASALVDEEKEARKEARPSDKKAGTKKRRKNEKSL